MKTLNHIQKLDTVFFYLKNEQTSFEFENIHIKYLQQCPNATGKELPLILNKLIKDGLVERFIDPNKNDRYIVTFDGLLFAGYEKTGIINGQNEKRIARNEVWVLRGTWAAAFVGALVLAWYIFSWIYPHYSDFVSAASPKRP